MIFVQIAAYKDPELLPTIRDCLANARWPNDLRFGICEQDETSQLWFCKHDPRFRIDFIPWREAKGLCWARSRIQNLYRGEDFTLQLDSHHRFSPNWDEELLRMMEQTGSAKPILTSYAGMYDPTSEGGKKLNFDPFKMVADKFTPSGTILFRPNTIPGCQDLTRPVPARFVSGHFFFTIGRHCEEYAYDPSLYFAGDEISLSIRSFTLGYDLFHPHRCVIWHEYTRQGRVKIWDDDSKWHEKDVVSKKRLRKLLREEGNDSDLTGFDLGTVRTHRDYEIYAGIDFANRRLSPCAISGDDPPCLDVGPVAEKWFSTVHCRSGTHCAACRNDRGFRESLVRSGDVSDTEFACPFGMSPPNPYEGPGTRLIRLLKRMGFHHTERCSCRDMALKMNCRGSEWCAGEGMFEILESMRKAAGDPRSNPMRIPFLEPVAARLVRHCAR